ncbi:M16 family metallopeptidase [Leptolyngbya sp. AN02str]|uniref:M16 family metallopeptidase n=1 Tax=Leptolyngbya sp. AN02str TaxID=3423363 RepID=UPI003D31F0BF
MPHHLLALVRWRSPQPGCPPINSPISHPVRPRIVHPISRFVAIALSILLLWSSSTATAMARTAAPPEATAPNSIQPYIDRAIERIQEFTLDNGIKFIVMERHQAPVVSFMTYVNVGAAEEAPGKTGAAHFLEHLAFKGTSRIGTRDYEQEQQVLNELDRVFDQLQAAKAANQTDEITRLQQTFDTLKAQSATFVEQNQYSRIVERAGGVGLNATTSADETRYFYSFPSNKLELWMSLESERFLDPVFREFHEEKDVILEERRLRTDNSPIGKMIEAFLETAYPNHPYGRPVIGYEEDIRNLTRKDIQDFFDAYYTPNRMVMAVVGDVDTQEVQRLAELYFGRYQARSRTPDIEATAPAQTEPREVTVNLQSQPWYIEGYQRPAISDPDSPVYFVLSSILSGGRTSRLYQALVEQQIALNVEVGNGFPGNRFPTIFMVYALTAPGRTVDEVAAAFNRELTRLKTEPVSAEELDRVKTQVRVSLLQLVSSNEGMASLLTDYDAKTGSWRNLFDELQAVETVTAEDIQRVAQATFVPEKLTIGRLLPVEGQS